MIYLLKTIYWANKNSIFEQNCQKSRKKNLKNLFSC